MMRIEIRNDAVLIDGYVNAVERDSKKEELILEHYSIIGIMLKKIYINCLGII